MVVDGAERFDDRRTRVCLDPSRGSPRPGDGVRVAVFALADEADVDRAVRTAALDPDGWRRMDMAGRLRVLSRAAVELRRARGDLIGAAAAVTGKVFTESDPEVSEAVDFARFYPLSAAAVLGATTSRSGAAASAVVVSPWNFPIAIPCGGIAAALAAGNTVILKPSSLAVPVAWLLCRCFWRAGVSRAPSSFCPATGPRPAPGS